MCTGALIVRCFGKLDQNAAVLSGLVDLHQKQIGTLSFEKKQTGHSNIGRSF